MAPCILVGLSKLRQKGSQMHIVEFTPSRMPVEGAIATILALLAPVEFIYGWHFYCRRIRREPSGRRNRISVLSLVLASLGALLWPVTMMFAPKADWGSCVGVAQQLHFVEACEIVATSTLLIAFVLSFFGRPRLIAPIAIAGFGTTLF